MKSTIQKNVLPLTVFITGACVLIIEVVATRILSPYYGNTIFTVSSILSVILAALSLGYYAGGKLADRVPSAYTFFKIIVSSGIALMLFHNLGTYFIIYVSSQLPLNTGPLVTSGFLFFLPALLLGTLSPYAIKLQSIFQQTQGIGSISGKMFFWSTLGSISGSLLAGFVLIPNFGVNNIIVSVSVTLFFLGLIPLVVLNFSPNQYWQLIGLMFFLIVLATITKHLFQEKVVYAKDGLYERITIQDGEYQGRPTRFFKLDRGIHGAMYLDTNDPTDLVYDYLKLYSVWQPHDEFASQVLLLGGGAYQLPRAILAQFPNTHVDVVEIEPALFLIAQDYLGLPKNPKLRNYINDGRRFLKNTNNRYDVIFSDVYQSLFSIPIHFTTQEYFQLTKDTLNNDGIFIANLIGDLDKSKNSLIFSVIKTIRSVYPNSYFFALGSDGGSVLYNVIAIGYKKEEPVSFSDKFIKLTINNDLTPLSELLIDLDQIDLTHYTLLTDDYAPVEYLNSKFIERNFIN